MAGRKRARRARGSALLAGFVLASLAGCNNDDDEQGIPTEPVLAFNDRPPGTCLRIEEDLPPEVTALPAVGCDEPHTHEIYAIVTFDESDVFPGMEALNGFAERECIRTFEPYVGISPFDSSLFFSWLVPSVDGWNNEDDRDVLCVLGPQDGALLTRSMRGARL